MVVAGCVPRLPLKAPQPGVLADRNTQIDWVSSPAGQNRADSEQAPQKSWHIPYRLANPLLNTGLLNGLLKAVRNRLLVRVVRRDASCPWLSVKAEVSPWEDLGVGSRD
jgi:hypothetical protein